MSPPEISVVMPLYNKVNDVGRAIQSVLKQSFTDFELIVVDDGSTDDGAEVVSSFADARISLIKQKNGGVSAARNRGIAEVRAEQIAFIDADDVWFPDFLSSVMRLRQNYPTCDIFATSYMIFKGEKYSIPRVNLLPTYFKEGVLENYFKVAAHSDPPLWTSAVSVTKKAIISVGGFPVGVTSGEDLVTWAKLASRFQIAYLLEPKAVYFEPLLLNNCLGRKPVYPDYVANELIKLLQHAQGDKRRDLSRYFAYWLKMRAVYSMSFGDNRLALMELNKALPYAPGNIGLRLLKVLLLFPNRISMAIYNFCRVARLFSTHIRSVQHNTNGEPGPL